MFVPEDNIVSNDWTLIEDKVDTVNDVGAVAQMNEAIEEVTAADVNDVHVANSRPLRTHTGVGVERIQIDFHDKGHQAKWEYNFFTNNVST